MTREELIRNLKYTMEKHKNDTVSTFGTNISVMCKDILDYLEQNPKWIPVSDRLPFSDEECHTFLVTDSNGNVMLSDFYLSLSDSKPYWSGMIDVIAWMPLPKPYEPHRKSEV